MSKKFRSLVGAILSTSIWSCCVSSGVSEVGILAKKIKELIGEDNYNMLKAFYELEKENLEGSGKPVGSTLASEGFILKAKACSSHSGPKSFNNVKEVMSWFNKDKSAPLVEVVGHLEFLFKSIFVTGNAEEVIRGDRESEFCFGGYGGFRVWFTDNSVFISCRHASYDDFSFELELRKMK